jgi:hypothetical protein
MLRLAAAGLFILPFTANAQGPCRDDAERLCADALGDRDAVHACLADNGDALSEACQERRAQRASGERRGRKGHHGRKGRRGLKKACAEDVAAHCADARGRGALPRCLSEHQAELSPVCSAKLDKVKARRAARHEGLKAACGADATALCPELEGRELRQCMRQNRADLSEGCSEAVKSMRGKRGERGMRGHKRGQRGHGALRKACADDAAQLCPDARGRALRSCMKDNAADLSESCSSAVSEMKARRAGGKAVRQACKADVAELCPDARGPERRACIDEHAESLSATCSQAIEARKALGPMGPPR